MLKGLLYLSILLLCSLTTINGRCHKKKQIVSISSGTSFGKCIGYCRRSINITSNPYQLLAIKEPNYPQPSYPNVEQQNSYSSQQWNQLVSLVDLKQFRLLNETIGCPDCADGGAEWIQIDWPDINKKVTFEYGQSIENFEQFINQLKQLREQYANNL